MKDETAFKIMDWANRFSMVGLVVCVILLLILIFGCGPESYLECYENCSVFYENDPQDKRACEAVCDKIADLQPMELPEWCELLEGDDWTYCLHEYTPERGCEVTGVEAHHGNIWMIVCGDEKL